MRTEGTANVAGLALCFFQAGVGGGGVPILGAKCCIYSLPPPIFCFPIQVPIGVGSEEDTSRKRGGRYNMHRHSTVKGIPIPGSDMAGVSGIP